MNGILRTIMIREIERKIRLNIIIKMEYIGKVFIKEARKRISRVGKLIIMGKKRSTTSTNTDSNHIYIN